VALWFKVSAFRFLFLVPAVFLAVALSQGKEDRVLVNLAKNPF